MAQHSEAPPGKTRYPWPEWSDGAWWTAQQGVDFTCLPRYFQNSIYRHARRHGLDAQVRVVGDTVTFRIIPIPQGDQP